MTSLSGWMSTFNHNSKMHSKLVTSVVYTQKNDIFVATNLQLLKLQENNF